jgi:hypothetical protein
MTRIDLISQLVCAITRSLTQQFASRREAQDLNCAAKLQVNAERATGIEPA